MGDLVLVTLLIVYHIVQGHSYKVPDASIEKMDPITLGHDFNNSATEPKQSKQVFKPSKQLFSNVLLPIDKLEQPQRYDRVYEQTNIIAPVSETRKDQIEKPEEILYGFPKELINYDQETKQRSIEIYPEFDGEISHKPIAHKEHSDSETVVTYNNPIPYLPENQSINSGPSKQKRKEVHYHQHKHLHDHEHKQDHLHKHRQEHVHDHGHTHQDNSRHDHYHQGQHGHHHIDEHYHTHEGSHHHDHHSSHQHNHQQEHKHDHQHQQNHDHHDKHNHEHNHKGEHSHDHRASHEHKHGHEHHSKHRHSRKRKDKHHQRYEREGHHQHSKHESKHKLVQHNIIIKKYNH